MSDSYEEFRARVERIYDKNEKSKRRRRDRVSRHIARDGTIVLRGRAPAFRIPWSGLMMILVAFFVTKGAVMATMGTDFYTAKATRAAPANVLEEAWNFTLRPDPISRWVALRMRSAGRSLTFNDAEKVDDSDLG